MSLQQQQIYLENAIEVREVKNLKLANRMLKKFREEKQKKEQAMQQQNIQAQQQAAAKTAEQTALAETQKQQVLTEQKIQLEQSKSEFEMKKLQMEADLKKQLMEQEFGYNMELAKAQNGAKQESETVKEDRKDQRTKMQATQQSQMISQRKDNSLPTNFESEGNDNVGGIELGQFEPQ